MNVMNYTVKAGSWQPKQLPVQRDQALKDILNKLCDSSFYADNPELNQELILKALVAREAQRSTAMGGELAFPHARLENLSQARLALATFDEPIMFEDEPVRIICLILVPISEPAISLQIMAQMSRIMMQSDMHDKICAAGSPESLRAIIKQSNPRIDKPILARDIMRRPRFSAQESELISTCAHKMSVNNLHAIPVINDQQEILGDLSVEGLFSYGLPEFFAQLKSVSFIAEFDPFEKFFLDERNTTAGTIMNKEPKVVPMDYTIMEIVFDLAIKSFTKIYVVDENNRWVGSIDKSTVLDNVINH